tara:strand:- start:299 stop:1363 length:1065 start_codon:yes stop_codon:yes gene_type:complete
LDRVLKFCLLGCGRIAKRHSELLGNRLIKNAQLCGVCDLDVAKAKAIANNFEVPFFKDMHVMMQEIKPDVVVILTESGNHAKITIELAIYKAHIIVEKPIALTLRDADNMIKVCEKNNINLYVIKQNRFNTPIIKLKEALDNGRFGKLVLGTVRVRWCRDQSYYDQASWRGSWSQDGGVLTNQAIHHIDMLLWMMGDVELVFGLGATQLVNIEAEDTGIVNLRFRNGALGIIEATTAARPKDIEGSISIMGEKGFVEVGGFAMNEIKHWEFEQPNKQDQDVLDKYSVNPPNVYGFGHQEYYISVVDSILNNRKYSIDGISGRKSLELVTAIYESIESGKPVYMNNLKGKIRLGN